MVLFAFANYLFRLIFDLWACDSFKGWKLNEIEGERNNRDHCGIAENSRRLKMRLSQTHKLKFKIQKSEML